MQVFAVVGTRSEQRQRVIQLAQSKYTVPNVYVVHDGIFVASDGQTTKEVSRTLGIGDDDNNDTGVVAMVDHFWGYHDRDLWEWIRARSKSNGD